LLRRVRKKMSRIKPEWVENEWVTVADSDPARLAELVEHLVEIGFKRDQIVHSKSPIAVFAAFDEKKSSILFIDESIGTEAFREIDAQLKHLYGENGFFAFAITEGSTPDFVQFSAEARIDGVIFRPYYADEFRRRVAEVFSAKWPNREVETPEAREDMIVHGKSDAEVFERAMEKEQRLGNRDALTPDGKISSIFGLKKVTHPAVNPGKASFTKVRLAFKASARNGEPLKKTYALHVLEIDEDRATFECAAADDWEVGDHITIEADIAHGDESYLMRIEALVQGDAGPGMIAVVFDKGNRTRFEAAMKMVAKRFRELKDFFKYA